MLQVGAETADAGGDRLAGFRMGADFARQGQQLECRVEIDFRRRHGLGQRCAFRFRRCLFALLLRLRFAELDIVAVRALRSEEHTSELQSLMRISYDVFCLKKKKDNHNDLDFNSYFYQMSAFPSRRHYVCTRWGLNVI